MTFGKARSAFENKSRYSFACVFQKKRYKIIFFNQSRIDSEMFRRRLDQFSEIFFIAMQLHLRYRSRSNFEPFSAETS